MKHQSKILSFCALLMITVISCGLFPATSRVTGGGKNGGSGGNLLLTASPVPSLTLTPSATPSPTPTFTPTPDSSNGPYLVKQTTTLGGETLGTPPGGICTNSPWQVLVSTPKVQFVMSFSPFLKSSGLNNNTVGYAYSISSAGESHQALGKYSLTPKRDGSVTVAVNIKDHVVFHGFDGNIPLRYKFDLIPMSSGAICP